MRKSILGIFVFFLLQISFLILSKSIFAQTPGLIYKPAINGGNKVLDPNGNGYVSISNLGFPGLNLDEGAAYSEIPYKPFPVFMDEPLSDLGTGAKGGHTDFAPKIFEGTTPVGSPLAAHFDGTNFLFRIRLGGQSTASKGYSILIDANNTLNNTGKNPGFEYEIVLCTNFDVRVYYHGDNVNASPVIDAGGQIIFSGSADQFSQKAIASSMGGGDPDYFYDLYVPLSVLNKTIPITATTPLRMTGVTVTSAKSGLFGVASDIGGVDDTKYQNNFIGALKDIINNTPTTTPTGIQGTGFTPIKAAAPVVSGPISKVGTTVTISGYSIEKAGSSITVYQNNLAIGTTTVQSDGTWSVQAANTTLVADRLITATVLPTEKTISDHSAPVRVQSAPCTTTAPPVITGTSNANKGITGTTSVAGLIKIYTVGTASALFSGNVPAGATWIAEWNNQGGALPSGTYYATVTVDGCESASSNQFCYVAGTGSNAVKYSTPAPTITPSTVTTSTATITVTGPAGSNLTLSKNGVQINDFQLASSATTWSVTLTGLNNGDVLYARATLTSPCTSTSGRSNAANVTFSSTPPQSAAPTISGSYCGTTSSVSGSSSEAPGTTIRLFNSTTQIGTTTTNAFGAWTISGLSITGGSTLIARATAPNKTESVASDPIIIGSNYVGATPAITSSPVVEGDITLKGTAASGAIMILYINGDPYVAATGENAGNKITVTTNGSGVWEFNNISPFDFYAGAKLTVTAKATTASNCESPHSAPVTVACKAADTSLTASFSSSSTQTVATICPGATVSVYLAKSEAGTIYNVYKKETNGSYTQFGASVLGYGSPITLVSAPVTATGILLQVRTIKVGAPCQYNIGGELTVNLYPPVPNTFALSGTNTTGCPGLTTTITLQNALAGYSYQLKDIDSNTKIGSAIVPSTAGDIVFPSFAVHKTTNYTVVITRLDGGCVAENDNSNTVTISRSGPTVNQAVTPSTATICTGQSASFSFSTQNTFVYRLINKSDNTVAQTITGNGGNMSLSTGILLTSGIRNYRIEVTGAGCSSNLTTEPTVTVSNGSDFQAAAGPDKMVCGNSFSLEGSSPAPGTGQWTIVSGPSTAVFSNATSANTTVTVSVSGDYVFRWTVTTNCVTAASTTDDVLVRVNCPAIITAGATKFYDEYAVGDALATISDDTDGGIQSFSRVKGIVPPGSSFAIESGKLMLKVASLPSTGGDYYLTMRTTDARGVATDSPILIRMYNRNQAPGGISPFPVELVYFRAVTEKKHVIISWETASEQDNDRFEIQRSTDGKKFYAIGTVKGNGTTSRSVKYSFVDADPISGVVYYRLQQFDTDRSSSYSHPVSVKVNSLNLDGSKETVQVYPNPFKTEFTATVFSSTAGTATLQLIDVQGKIASTNTLQLSSGTTTHSFNLTGLARGMYILKIIGIEINSSTKLIKSE